MGAAAAAASAAAVGEVAATATSGVERAVALAAALVDLRVGGGGFLAGRSIICIRCFRKSSAAAVAEVVATAAAAVAPATALLVDWRWGELSPTAGTVAGRALFLVLVGMTDV